MPAVIEKLPLLAIVLIVSLCALGGYFQVTDFLNERDSAATKSATTQVASSPVATPKPQRNIASFKLFGDASAKPKPVQQQTENLPKTNLKLTLRGVSAGFGDQINNALIESAGGETLLYKEGDELPGNAEVSSIYADRVVISRSGRLENLYFPTVSKGGGYLVSAVNTSDQEPEDLDAAAYPTQAPVTPTVSPARTKSIKDRLDAIRSRIRAGRN